MSFSWVPATHTNTHAHVLTPGSSLLGKNAAFSLSSIITMLSDSLHSSSLKSAASHSGQSQRTYTHSVIHSTGPARYSPGQRKSSRDSPQKGGQHPHLLHMCVHSLYNQEYPRWATCTAGSERTHEQQPLLSRARRPVLVTSCHSAQICV